MKGIKTLLVFLTVPVLCAGCARIDAILRFPPERDVEVESHEHGPPPHAPAHGYRHKHQHGVQLKFDTAIGAYVVTDLPDTYFFNGLYIRLSPDGRWTVATHFDSPWRVAVEGEIPLKLLQKKGKKHSKGKKW